jgi:hypothetical protein
MDPIMFVILIAFGFGAGTLKQKPCNQEKPAQVIEQKQETKSCKSQK